MIFFQKSERAPESAGKIASLSTGGFPRYLQGYGWIFPSIFVCWILPSTNFLPESESDQKALAEYLDKEVREIAEQGEKLKEFNPMLGHRGCRLGITYPEIYRMQARAIIEAALAAQAEGVKVYPEIMIPLVFCERGIDRNKRFFKK